MFFKWIDDNKEWLFSGAGLVGITFALSHWQKIKHSRIAYRVLFWLNRDGKYGNEGRLDDSKYISETPPDGTRAYVGETFKKSWTILNCGETIWKNRYMVCDPLPAHLHVSSTRVKMPTVYPGEEYTLSVEFTAGCEGTFRSYWKMYDMNHELVFPRYEGLGVTFVAKIK